jgi:putative membrane protein
MHAYDWGWSSGWGWAMGVMMIVFWGLVIAAIVYAISTLNRSQRGWAGPTGEPPLDILDRRYARGEITREQYEQMRQDLTRRGGGAPAGA